MLELSQCLCKAAVTKPKPGEAVGWAHGGTLSSHPPGMSGRHCVWPLCPRRTAGQIAPFIPLLCLIGKNWKGQLLQLPILAHHGLAGRWCLLLQPSLPSPDPAAVVGKLCGRDVGSCSNLLH